MDPDSFILILIVFLILILLSTFFSGTETAYFSLTEVDLQELRKKATKRSCRTVKLLSNPKTIFIAIRIGALTINIALIGVGILLAEFITRFSDISFALTLFIMVCIVAFILFIINELWVKLFVLSYNRTYAELVSFPLMLFYLMILPIANIIAKLVFFLSSKLKVSSKSTFFNHQKIMALVEENEEIGNLEENEREMIHSIFEFGETEVHEIMVPRTDMVCVEEGTSLKELTKLIKNKGHSRIPLYGKGVDNIVGIIHAKDLLPYIINEGFKKLDLKSLARPVYFVPESKKLQNLLKEFQQEKSHMAIVVDEYGGTAGLVTLEDVIEEIVGDIQDEYDQEPPLYLKLDENSFLVDAKIDLHELNEELGIDLPTKGEYESLGGFILFLTGYVPEENEIVKYKCYSFIVDKVIGNRIVRIKLSIDKPLLEDVDQSKDNDA
ncbi:MAG: hemolysin family protein [bacterium]